MQNKLYEDAANQS